MARGGLRNPRDRDSLIRVSRKRAIRKIARTKRGYVARRYATKRIPVLNPRIQLKGKRKGTQHLEIPDSLGHEREDNLCSLTECILQLKETVFLKKMKRIVIDLTNVRDISPGSALMLLAEIKRCRAYAGDRTQITGTYPRDHGAREILNNTGFFEALNVKPPDIKEEYEDRTYVKIVQNNKVDAELVDKMLTRFEDQIEFKQEERKTLYLAILECMDNVREHAYMRISNEPHLYKEWWMAGYADHVEGTVSFIFYDQGVGIPLTIRRRKHRRALDRLTHWTDAHWIQRALRRRESRHPSKRRGHGLKRLRAFNTTTSKTCLLRIMSNKGHYILDENGKDIRLSSKPPLGGSFIEWKLSPD